MDLVDMTLLTVLNQVNLLSSLVSIWESLLDFLLKIEEKKETLDVSLKIR